MSVSQLIWLERYSTASESTLCVHYCTTVFVYRLLQGYSILLSRLRFRLLSQRLLCFWVHCQLLQVACCWDSTVLLTFKSRSNTALPTFQRRLLPVWYEVDSFHMPNWHQFRGYVDEFLHNLILRLFLFSWHSCQVQIPSWGINALFSNDFRNLCVKLLLLWCPHQVEHVQHLWDTYSRNSYKSIVMNPRAQRHQKLTVLHEINSE